MAELAQGSGDGRTASQAQGAQAMVRAADFRFNGYQGAALYGDVRLQIKPLLRLFLDRFDSVLDGEPVLLPVPVEAPAEIPRMFLGAKDESIRIEVGLARL